MQQNDSAFFRLLEESNQLVDLDLLGDGIVVRIVIKLETTSLDDALVVGPSRSRDQDSRRQLLLYELESHPQSTSA